MFEAGSDKEDKNHFCPGQTGHTLEEQRLEGKPRIKCSERFAVEQVVQEGSGILMKRKNNLFFNITNAGSLSQLEEIITGSSSLGLRFCDLR